MKYTDISHSETVHVKASENCIIVAGPNGSGKTTFAKAYLEKYDYNYINADDIAFHLNPEQPEKAGIMAGRLFFKKLSDLLGEKKEILIETTLSGQGFQGILNKLQQKEYIITIIFIFLENPDVCIARVKERVLNGGHDVPEPDIIRRFYRSKENFRQLYKNRADFWYLFYNSGDYFQEVVTGEGSSYIVDIFGNKNYN